MVVKKDKYSPLKHRLSSSSASSSTSAIHVPPSPIHGNSSSISSDNLNNNLNNQFSPPDQQSRMNSIFRSTENIPKCGSIGSPKACSSSTGRRSASASRSRTSAGQTGSSSAGSSSGSGSGSMNVKRVQSAITKQRSASASRSSLRVSTSGTSSNNNNRDNNHSSKDIYSLSTGTSSLTSGSGGTSSSTRERQHKKQTFECDFDKNPTKLYLHIQLKQWQECIDRSKAYPLECKTWVSRKEPRGDLRWRLLPLHAAVIFKAPDYVVEALLIAYPRAAKQKDDQGMLPAHLAVRNESPLPIAQCVLLAYPSALESTDRKGRTPMDLAQKLRPAKKEIYVTLLSSSQSYFDVATAAFESNSIHNYRKHSNASSMPGLQHELDAEKINLMAKIDALQNDLDQTHGASEVLVNHVNSLEAKLSSNNDTESFLAAKIARMDGMLKDVTQAKEIAEVQVIRERNKLLQENERLQSIISEMQDQLEQQDDRDKSMEEAMEVELSAKNTVIVRLQVAETKARECEEEMEAMEALLNKKIQSEHTLANQVSTLATRLADSTSDSCQSMEAFQKRIDALMAQNETLKSEKENYGLMTNSILSSLDHMTVEHEKILSISSKHEHIIAEAQKQQMGLAANAARNEQLMMDATWEREEIVRILTRQAKEVEQTTAERKRLQNAVQEQNVIMEEASKERSQLVNSIESQKEHMNRLKLNLNQMQKSAASGSNSDSNSNSPSGESGADMGSDISVDATGMTRSVGKVESGSFDIDVGVSMSKSTIGASGSGSSAETSTSSNSNSSSDASASASDVDSDSSSTVAKGSRSRGSKNMNMNMDAPPKSSSPSSRSSQSTPSSSDASYDEFKLNEDSSESFEVSIIEDQDDEGNMQEKGHEQMEVKDIHLDDHPVNNDDEHQRIIRASDDKEAMIPQEFPDVDNDLLPNTSTLTESLLVDESHHQHSMLLNDTTTDLSNTDLSNIESSVDQLCNEAARLVANMPTKKMRDGIYRED